MTSTLSTLLRSSARFISASVRGYRALALIAIATFVLGCARDRFHEPLALRAPYDHPQVWAVAPFTNESGVSYVDPYRLADLFAQQVQDIRGVHVIPVNRVILAMRELDMLRITGPTDVRMLMGALGVDGMIVGTITAYDPYRPLTLGAAVELHLADRVFVKSATAKPDIDTWKLTRSPTGDVAAAEFSPAPSNPIAQAAGIFDATNHRTLAELEAYATGRAAPDSAYGRDIYLVSMDMYAQFVSFRLLRDLLHAERSRIIAEAVRAPDSSPAIKQRR